jgi:REP element-mobilizing transposase RayT
VFPNARFPEAFLQTHAPQKRFLHSLSHPDESTRAMESTDEVIAYHVTFGTYGFWLPNDPRGSFSNAVRAPHLRPFGPATKVDHRESVAHVEHDTEFRRQAKRALIRPKVVLNEQQIARVAAGFETQIEKSGYQVFACAILAQHVHLVIAHHRYSIEQVVRLLKQSATAQLIAHDLHPFTTQRSPRGTLPSVWEQDFWKVFLYTYDDVFGAIAYVQDNPEKDSKPRQTWPFVKMLEP